MVNCFRAQVLEGAAPAVEFKVRGIAPASHSSRRVVRCASAATLMLLLALCDTARAQSFDRGRDISGLDLAELAATQVFTLADVNGDGFPDIVTVGERPDDVPAVIVLFNDRGGGFGGPVYFTDDEVGELDEPIAVEVADVGSPTASDSFGAPDRNPDIIVLDASAELVIVLWGNGTGDFEFSTEAERVDLTDFLEGEPVGFAVGNFDGDHGGDIVVLDSGADKGQLIFLCNNPRSPFLACATDPNPVRTGGEDPIAVVTGDFNADGRTDVVVLNSAPDDGNLVLFNGNGRGSFTRPTGVVPALGQANVRAMTVARVDANNTDDVVVSYTEVLGGDSIQVFLGGARLSAREVVTGVAFRPVALARGDFNGDGISDLVAAQESPQNESFVMRGDGQGGFVGVGTSQGVLTGSAIAVKVADLDRDGDDDFIVARQDRDGFRIALNARIRGTPTPTFTGTPPTATPTPPPTHTRTPTNTATPTPIPTVPFDACPVEVGGMPVALAAAQLDGDLNFDLIVADGQGRLLSLSPDPATIRNVSCENLSPFTSRLTTLSGAPSAITVGNLDRGLVADDLAVAVGETVFILYNDGSGGFTQDSAPLTLPASPDPGAARSVAAIAIADLNNDGAPDIITANQGRPALAIFPGQPGGGFEEGRSLGVGRGATAVLVTNLGRPQSPLDLVAIIDLGGQTTQIVGFLQTDALTFDKTIILIDSGALGGVATAIVADNFNGDVIQDIGVTVRTGPDRGKFMLFRGVADVEFEQVNVRFEQAAEITGTARTPIENPVALVVGDFELRGGRPDNRKDVVIADNTRPQGRLFFLEGDGRGGFTALDPVTVKAGVVSLSVADVDGDGRDDVVVAHSDGSLSLIRSSQPFPTHTPTETGTPTPTPTPRSPTATQATSTPEPPPGTATSTGTPKPGTFTLSDGCAIAAERHDCGAGVLGAGLLIWFAGRRARRTARGR